MNLFFLHPDPETCAKQHCDKHVVKMILELVQMLFTCHIFFGSDLPPGSYRSFNPKHPTNLWIQDSINNYIYTVTLLKYLCEEYTHRYNKIHKCQNFVEFLTQNYPDYNNHRSVYAPGTYISYNKIIQSMGMTPVPLAMFDDVKVEDTIIAYRNYYNVYKKRFAKWTNREVPYWFSKINIFHSYGF
jgi:hypothetical protein